jgi:ubiquinone/menaquinone biosynthesis C-methylase UbiE
VSRLADRIFARLYDPLFARCEREGLSDLRRQCLSRASGEVLELGAGTGLNLEHYPEAVTRLVLTEPEEVMAAQLRKRLGEGDRDSEVHIVGAETLPFPDDSFDTVTSTLVLCTAPDPHAVLAETSRVLRPGGLFLFMEHVRAGDGTTIGKWQDRAERPWGFIAGGCHPNRRTAATLESSALEVIELQQTEMPKAAGPLVRPMILGVARAA